MFRRVQNPVADPFGIVGQVLDGQFRVDRLVGEGGFSAVYRGHHVGLDEPIAVKCLKLPPSVSPPLVDTFVKRFRDESRILYRLSQGNLNIVRSMAAGTWQAPTGLLVPYMILEWLEGRSLANELTIRRTVGQQGRPLDEILNVFASAADGLGYAHSQGVVHRDLNPGNLFVSSAPGARMKVLDFGVAKILDDAALNIGPRQMTVGQIRIFAPAYGAPEQFDDAIGPVGAASDVYSFALIVLEALRDRCVNEGAHLGEFAQKATNPARRPTPRVVGLQVPDEVEQVFGRALALDPRQRYQSVGEFWQALTMASQSASQERHAQAAHETPALAMPQGQRSTQKGMGNPPPEEETRVGALGGPRMDRTLPIGAVMPSFPRVGAPPAARPAAGRPATPNAPPVRESQPRVPAIEPIDELPTEPVNADTEPPAMSDEVEEEVTRIREPDVDMLRNLADVDPRGMQTLAHGSSPLAGGPRPAAGAPVPAAGAPPPQPMAPPPPQMPPPPQPMAPPLQMQQMPPQMQPPFGQPPPFPGPQSYPGNPMMPPQQGFGPPGSMPGMPPPQGGGLGSTMAMASMPHPMMGQQMPPQMQQMPPQMQPHGMPMTPSQPMSPQPMPPPPGSDPSNAQSQFGPPSFTPRDNPFREPAASLVPGSVQGVPQGGKKNTMVIVLVAFAVLLVLGGGGIAAALVLGKKVATTDDGGVAATSASVAATTAPAPTPTPEPTPTPAPTPEPPPAAEEVVDAGPEPAATAEPAPTATATAATNAPAQPVATWTAPPKPAEPAADPNAFNEGAARSKLSQANSVLVFCKKADGVTGPGTASVTFGSDGAVTEVKMQPPYAGTPAGECVAGQYRRTKVSPFQGSPRTITQQFDVPK